MVECLRWHTNGDAPAVLGRSVGVDHPTTQTAGHIGDAVDRLGHVIHDQRYTRRVDDDAVLREEGWQDSPAAALRLQSRRGGSRSGAPLGAEVGAEPEVFWTPIENFAASGAAISDDAPSSAVRCDSSDSPQATAIAISRAAKSQNTLKFHLIGSPTCRRWTQREG